MNRWRHNALFNAAPNIQQTMAQNITVMSEKRHLHSR